MSEVNWKKRNREKNLENEKKNFLSEELEPRNEEETAEKMRSPSPENVEMTDVPIPRKESHRNRMDDEDNDNEEELRSAANKVHVGIPLPPTIHNAGYTSKPIVFKLKANEASGKVGLYLDCGVNGNPIKASINTGAEYTKMKESCANRCGVDHQIEVVKKNTYQAGEVVKGEIREVSVKIGKSYFQCAIVVLGDQSMKEDFVFGLDMLQRHQGIVNLLKNEMVIGNEKIPFLTEEDEPVMRNADEEDAKRLRLPPAFTFTPPTTTTFTAPNVFSTSNLNPPVAFIPPTTTNVFTTSNLNPPVAPPKYQSTPTINQIPTPTSMLYSPQLQQLVQELVQKLNNVGISDEEAAQLLLKNHGNVELAADQYFRMQE